jgi:hypothetical protein
MWATLYEELAGRVYWYLCFSEEKGQLEKDLAHAMNVYQDICRNPYEDTERQTKLVDTLELIIEVFSNRIEDFKSLPTNELGTEECPYKKICQEDRYPASNAHSGIPRS